jgi:hypothetical protein
LPGADRFNDHRVGETLRANRRSLGLRSLPGGPGRPRCAVAEVTADRRSPVRPRGRAQARTSGEGRRSAPRARRLGGGVGAAARTKGVASW